METKQEFDLGSVLLFLRKNWHWVLLVVILLFAFKLRLYHLDYPVVGYHNWKEVHYLTEARNFAKEGFFQYGFFVPAFDYPDLNQRPEGQHSDSFPTISILVALLFKVIGYEVSMARLLGILFNVGAILYLYLTVRKLFNREDLALVSAAIMALNPLMVFFSRNVQLDNPALFFMMGSAYYFLLWRESNAGKHLLLTSAFLSLALLTRYTFILILFPMLFLFPWRRFKELFQKEQRTITALAIILLLPVPLWFFYSNFYLPTVMEEIGEGAVFGGIIDFSIIFEKGFWDVMKAYAADNYTFLGLFFALLGLFCMLFFWKKEKLGNTFLLSYVLGSILWLLVMGEKLSGHSYHQYPLVPLFSILVAYSFIVIAQNIEKIIKLRYSSIGIMVLLLFWLSFPSTAAWNRQFDTIFPGLDVAGAYIQAHSLPGEKIWHSSHQNYGILWHADRKGYKLPSTVEELNLGESLGATWMFIYQWRFSIFQEPIWEEIQRRYSLRQLAFVQQGENTQPIYFLLQKGGSFNMSQLNSMAQNRQAQVKEYETSRGKVQIGYINFE